MTNEQHYRVALADAVRDYQDGLITAKGAIAYWIRIHLKPGWKRKIDPKEIREAFQRNGKPMPRSTFHNALHQLQEEGQIAFDEPSEIFVTRIDSGPNLGQRPKSGTAARIWDSGPNSGSASQILASGPNSGSASQISNERPPDPLQEGRSSDHPDYSHISSDFSHAAAKGSVSKNRSKNFQDPFLARARSNPQARSRPRQQPDDPWTEEGLKHFYEALMAYAETQPGIQHPHSWARRQISDVREKIPNPYWKAFSAGKDLSAVRNNSQQSQEQKDRDREELRAFYEQLKAQEAS
ncbi:MAG: hypothetical protein J7642_21210 [Cyanobacteria bacterium SBC]|nr:hypothetical protein [Cyanobacteria bacterium SBC]